MGSDKLYVGDILVLEDGKMCKYLGPAYRDKVSDMVWVQFVDEDQQHFIGRDKAYKAKNLGHSDIMFMAFHSAHHIHSRLNRLGKV